ncbi:aminoacyl-tRNA hydrolase [Idiomarina xiamenensis]|uniref:Peptidyl-tRNA hydrolase n=1 Tax=Idiomarina xiamenensis 10-D-4 TaxID=740709 RepID=K2K5E1_9GAMM|nr:aminoacyl-tRNA hydrolase [Idiomarina xiamenensis]EKE82788.1 peptidyl-tRNA hydrolase [Idiomarina xiamenensis 10-D-4]
MDNDIRLIVGLGNPGPEYQHTRHNAGVWFIDQLARQYRLTLTPDSKFFGASVRLQQGSSDVRLLIPDTFMNLSGKAVAAMANFYKIAPEQILVAYDELDLPPGVARFKRGGGAGGHNGIKDIIAKLGSQQFLRLRLGIGHPGDKSRVTGFVLGKPPSSEFELIAAAIDEACASVQILREQGLAKAQQRLHSFKANA